MMNRLKRGTFILLKRIQCFWIVFLFGPFYPSLVEYGNKEPGFSFSKIKFFIYSLVYYSVLYILPVNWIVIIIIHCISCLTTSIYLNNPNLPGINLEKNENTRFKHSLISLCIGLLPILYVNKLLSEYYNLLKQSVNAPQDIFWSGFQSIIYFFPFIVLVAIFCWKKKIYFRTIHFVYFYTAILFLFIVYYFVKWSFELWFIDHLYNYSSMLAPNSWKNILGLLFGIGILISLIPYLVFSNNLNQYFRRLITSVELLLLSVFSFTIISGVSDAGLSKIRSWSYLNNKSFLYQTISALQLIRSNPYVNNLDLMLNLAEVKYQLNDKSESVKIWNEFLELYGESEKWGEPTERTRHILNHLNTKASSKFLESPSIFLNVPTIQYENYIPINWYSLLSAILYLDNELREIDVKRKLHDTFYHEGKIENQIPQVEDIPSLLPALNRLKVKAGATFFTDTLLVKILKKKSIPLVYLRGNWVTVTGYDADRDGFVYFDYTFLQKSAVNKKEDMQIIFKSDKTKKFIVNSTKFSLKKYITRDQLNKYIKNYGGVGVVIGDTSYLNPNSTKAAYLIEQGDWYYQNHNNFEMAADSYNKAYKFQANWIVEERMAYLKRYYRQYHDLKFNRNSSDILKWMYKKNERPNWYLNLPVNDFREREITERVLEGKAGEIILEYWPNRPPILDKAHRDTLLMVYEYLHKNSPYNINYLDSLARLVRDGGNLNRSQELYKKLLDLHQGRDPRVSLELAWVKLLQNKLSEIEGDLHSSQEGINMAKYLTLRAASQLSRGMDTDAKNDLVESLKIDKTLGETHFLFAKYYQKKNDLKNQKLHLKWYERIKGSK